MECQSSGSCCCCHSLLNTKKPKFFVQKFLPPKNHGISKTGDQWRSNSKPFQKKTEFPQTPILSFSEGPIADSGFLRGIPFFFLGFFWVPMVWVHFLGNPHGVRWRVSGTERHIWWHAFHHSFRSPDRLVELSRWLIASRVVELELSELSGHFFPE